MNRKTTKLTAFLTAILCVTGLASCGKDVPQSENSGLTSDLNITEITTDTNNENPDGEGEVTSTDGENPEATTTSVLETKPYETESTTTAVTTNESFSFVTRNPADIPTTKKPVTTSPAIRTTVSVVTTKITGNAPTVTVTTTYASTTASTGTVLTGITLSYYSAEVSVGQTIQYPVVSENIREIWSSSNENVASVDRDGNITGKGEGECIIRVVSADNANIGAEVRVTVKKSEGIQQIDGITYANNILIANKTYSLPSSYNPGGLTNDTYSAFQQLSADASNYAGLSIYLSSGFRSYETQEQIYNNYVYTYGQDVADTFSARPGYSEHQTGLAIDVNTIDDSFADTPEAVWLAEHCHEYGFIIRYPKGKSHITGYKYEPWHIRYVGKETAQEIHDAGIALGDTTLTLEEYLGIDSYYH